MKKVVFKILKELTDKEFELIRNYLKSNFGINLGKEKKSFVYSRLRSVLLQNNMDNFTDYYHYLENDKTGHAISTFIEKMSTNHTFFMRETDHFDFFVNTVLPSLEKEVRNKDLCIWCAGCSSGEEAYTLQILLHEYFGPAIQEWNTQLLATDISTKVLNMAIRGVFKKEQVQTIPNEWLRKYFEEYDQDNYIVAEKIKKQILFRRFNLMENHFQFKKKFHVIFCRNVMIYYDNPTKDQLIEKFYQVSEDNGYLFIGHSESLNFSKARYRYVIPAVYQK